MRGDHDDAAVGIPMSVRHRGGCQAALALKPELAHLGPGQTQAAAGHESAAGSTQV
jgi:hypothetical protein